MSANALLLWMSARREGSWQQFRTAVEELHIGDAGATSSDEDDPPDPIALPLYQTLRLNLQRLGHAEFFAGAGGAEWRVAPPSLAVTPAAGGWLGVLAGARSPNVLQRVHSARGVVRLTTLTMPACPDALVFVAGDDDALATLAERAGLFLQRDAPAALLACLPPIDDSAIRHPVAPPFGADWRIDRFSPEDLRWRSSCRDEAVAASWDLFRFSLRHQRYVLFCSRGTASRVPGQVGKFLALRRSRQRVIRYDAQTRLFEVAASCRPPFLVERALVLCSGSLPSYGRDNGESVLRYAEVPGNIATAAAALLRQELR